MDKEAIALIIAGNGLKTANTLFTVKAAKLRVKAGRASGDEAAKLNKAASKAEKLAKALQIADEGITQYQAETSE